MCQYTFKVVRVKIINNCVSDRESFRHVNSLATVILYLSFCQVQIKFINRNQFTFVLFVQSILKICFIGEAILKNKGVFNNSLFHYYSKNKIIKSFLNFHKFWKPFLEILSQTPSCCLPDQFYKPEMATRMLYIYALYTYLWW